MDEVQFFTIRTDYQTAGRGQMGNGWESERGKNLLFSTLIRDLRLDAHQSFRLTEIVALALYDAVRPLVKDKEALAIKWPNDLYYGHHKLAGILIETTLLGGAIDKAVVGIGLNVNQTCFLSTAPNPISIRQITNREEDREAILERFIEALGHYLRGLDDTPFVTGEIYRSHLYRREGFHAYVEREVDISPTMPVIGAQAGSFDAEIAGITEQGELILRMKNGEERTYHFKQIRYVL